MISDKCDIFKGNILKLKFSIEYKLKISKIFVHKFVKKIYVIFNPVDLLFVLHATEKLNLYLTRQTFHQLRNIKLAVPQQTTSVSCPKLLMEKKNSIY